MEKIKSPESLYPLHLGFNEYCEYMSKSEKEEMLLRNEREYVEKGIECINLQRKINSLIDRIEDISKRQEELFISSEREGVSEHIVSKIMEEAGEASGLIQELNRNKEKLKQVREELCKMRSAPF